MDQSDSAEKPNPSKGLVSDDFKPMLHVRFPLASFVAGTEPRLHLRRSGVGCRNWGLLWADSGPGCQIAQGLLGRSRG